MSDLAVHPNSGPEMGHEATPSGEHRGAVATVVAMGREALRSAGEIVTFTKNTFSANGEQRNLERYGDKAHSDRWVERTLSASLTTKQAQERRASRAERSANWEYGVVGRARVAAHRSPLAAIAMNRTPRHPSDVPGYRSRRTGKYVR